MIVLRCFAKPKTLVIPRIFEEPVPAPGISRFLTAKAVRNDKSIWCRLAASAGRSPADAGGLPVSAGGLLASGRRVLSDCWRVLLADKLSAECRMLNAAHCLLPTNH